MKRNEIWGMEPKEFHKLIGAVEIATGLSIISLSILLIGTGVGSLLSVIGGLGGLKLVAKGGKELLNAEFNPRYQN